MSLDRIASLLRKARPAARRHRPARGLRLVLEHLEDRLTPSTLIPVANHRDLAFDALRGQLDVTTSSGQVQRWSLVTQSLLSPYNVGTSLYGADITPDNNYLYATEGQTSGGLGTVHKVNLGDGTVTNLTYSLASGETGSYSLAVGDNGKALFDGQLAGSGWVPLRQIDLATGTLSTRSDDPGSGGGGQVRQNTMIRRGADGSLFLLTEANISSGPAFTYNATADTFAKTASNTNLFLDNRQTAVNRNGSLLAVEMPPVGPNPGSVSILDANLHLVKNLPAIDGGVLFDPSQDVLYGVSTPGGVVVAFDTNTWAVKFTAPIGEAVSPGAQFGNGVMAVSPNSQYVFLATASGVREILLPPPTGVGMVLVPGPGFPTYIKAGVQGNITITAKDPAGNVVPNFADTVQLTSSDPSVTPITYTFQPATDHGVHTFAVTLNTVGTQSINVTDLNHGFGVGQGNITVHPALPAPVIPVPDHEDLVYDPTRNYLYITTAHGLVQRYDVANQTLLAPFQVGVSLLGADITPDGKYLYAADNQRGATEGTFHKVDLTTGAVTELPYAQPVPSFTVAIGPAGKALADLQVEGSGSVPLYQIDLSTDALTVRSDPPGTGFGGAIAQSTLISRGADRGLFFFTQSNISSGPVFTYNATADTFAKTALNTSLFLDGRLSAVNRNGTLIAGEVTNGAVSVLDANMNRVKELAGIDGGVAFDPTQDVLYGVSTPGGVVVAFDTNTWATKWVMPVGETVHPTTAFGNGVMAVSSDGKSLFLVTPTGVRQYALPPATGVAASLLMTGLPAYLKAGVPATITLTARDPAGNVATGYAGKVHFTSTDGAAGLPQDYTFQPSDNGTHTFTMTLNTAGSQSVAVSDGSLSAGQSAPVHTDVTALVPVATHKDMVYDPTRNYLYITSADGTVQRYDVANQTLLAPFQAGVSLLGADVTPDGKYLYVADNQRGLTQGSFHAVNLTTGAVTDLNYTLDSGSWDVALGANGKGFADEQVEGSGWVPLYQVDTGANTLTPVSNDPGSGFGGQVRQNTMIRRSADRSLFFFTESNISSGPMFDYNATTATWSKAVDTGAFLDNVPAAVNRNGTLIAIQLNGNVDVLDPTLNLASPVHTLTGVTGALEFDPTRDLLYVANGSTVTAYNTGTWAVQFSLPVGESVGSPTAFGNGEMTVSPDDKYLFVATPSGVRVLGLPAVAQLVVSGFPASTTAGASGSITVTAEDGGGHVMTGYSGTVHFTSSDGQAVLPADYAFQPSDNGTHTFTNAVTLKTAGTQSVTATDTVTGSVTGSQTGITVNAAAATQLVVTIQPPSSVNVGAGFGLTVSAEDPYGNVGPTFGGIVAVALANNPGGATLGGNTSVPASKGVAAFSGLTLDQPGTGYTLQATAAGLTPATTAAFSVKSGITGVNLSNSSVPEFRPVGTPVGALSSTEAGGGHTFTYALVSGTGSADNASFTISGSQLLTADAFDAGAKSSYSVRVRSADELGGTFDQPFTITVTDDPALTLSGRTLTVTGTSGNDAFSFAPGAVRDSLALNGAALAVDAASVDGVAFNGGGGTDSATLTAGTGANTLNLAPGGGTLGGTGYQVTLSGVAQVIAVGHAGDRAYFTGSAGSDAFVGTPTYAYLRGAGYFNQADGFGVALASGAGGGDTAYLYDSAGNDAFVGTPAYAYLYGSGFFNQANGFSVVVGTAGAGSDTAYLYGSAAGGNVFVGTPAYSYLYGSGFFNQAGGFKVVVGNGAGAGDSAHLYGSAAGGNVLVATPSYSYQYGAGFFNQAQGFQTTVGNSSGPGDVAYLYDAAGGTYVATSTYAYVSGGGLLQEAVGFGSVYGYSGGGDGAFLYGTLTAADTYVSAGGYGYLYGSGFFELESGFASVTVNPNARR